MRYTLLLFASILPVACGASFGADLEKAEAAFDEGRAEDARRIARDLVEREPAGDHEAAWFADLLVKLGDPSSALGFLSRNAGTDGPEISDARIAALLVAGGTNYLDRAEKEIGGRFVKGTETARTWQLRGRLALARGDLERARSDLSEAQGRNAADPLTWALLGLTLYRLNERERAEELLWDAHRRHPESPEVRVALAGVLLPGRENLRETLEAVAELLGYVEQKRPLDLDSRVKLGAVLNRLGRFRESRRVLRRLTRDAPNLAGPWTNLGVANAELRDYEEAATCFETALSGQPDSIPLLLNLGTCHLELAGEASDRKPHLDRAENAFLRVLELDETQAMGYVGLGRVAVKRNPASDPQAQTGIFYYRKALEHDPDCFDAHLNLALLYYDVWLPQEKTVRDEGFWRAKEHFKRAAAIRPPSAWTRSAREAYEKLR